MTERWLNKQGKITYANFTSFVWQKEIVRANEIFYRHFSKLLESTYSKNRKLLRRFFEYELEKQGISARRKIKYLVIIRRILEIRRDLSRLNQKDVERFFFMLKSSNLSSETKEDYWNMFRKFARWVNPKLNFDYKLFWRKKQDFPDILTLKEVRKLLAVAKHPRDKALISLAYDSGARPGELLYLKLKDVMIDEQGVIVLLRGKTGARRIRVIDTVGSTRHLAVYLQFHEFVDDGNSWLFYNLDKHKNEPLTRNRFSQILKNLARKAKISKRVYPYVLRHSRATYLARYLTEQEMKIYFGWVMDSKMVKTYVHMSCRDLDEKAIMLSKLKPDELQEFQAFLIKMFKTWKTRKLEASS